MKTVIYQIMTRLYGNTNPTRKHNGTIAENGCGKFNDINDAALDGIAQLGVTHVWYTGVLRHASATSYPFMTKPANANVVKGKAGSPYAICDYYDVDPDLAQDVEHRMDEFKALVERTHRHGMKCIIDFVPNHVARNYHSDVRPDIPQFGQNDDTSAAFAPNNNFYYIPNQQFVSPVADNDVPYYEMPAKASGNDAFTASPSINDWYETVKLNYGVDYRDGSRHFDPKPDTWYKMREILLYWADTGIDGFRVDMAEMVPAEFWQWVIAQVNALHPNIIFVAETYDMQKYREYIAAGFNYLYDKVNFYDITRDVMCGRRPANDLSHIHWQTSEISRNMLYFLENHDEQRIGSDFFVGNGAKGKPGMMLTALYGNGGTMIYFGQELGERGMDCEGFSGTDGRTTIFDYWGIATVQQYVANHAYDGSQLPPEARELRQWYVRLMQTVQQNNALKFGQMYDLMWVNQNIFVDASKIFAFLRYDDKDRFLIVLNFADVEKRASIRIPRDAWKLMGNTWNECIRAYDLLDESATIQPLSVETSIEHGIKLNVTPYGGMILRL